MLKYFKKLGVEAAQREFAPGIPAARAVQPLPEVRQPQTWTLAIQRHHADRAGEHLDLRLVDPDSGYAHSWAIPRASLPKPGESVLAVQQPTHTADYAVSFGRKGPQKITEGYGKGTVVIEEHTPIDVYHSKPELEGTRVRFNVYKGTHPEEYAIVRTKDNTDILVNKTLSRDRLSQLPLGQKPKLKEQTFQKIDVEDNNQIVMPKLDGAHTLLSLPTAGKIPRLFSYRLGRRAATGVIEHTHKAPSLLNKKVPAGLGGTLLRSETIAVNKETGQALAAKDLAGLLNASVPVSRERQRELGAEVKPILFDIEKYRGRDVSTKPFAERHKLLVDIARQLKLDVVETATTPKEKSKLLAQIKNKQHPLTQEGVITRNASGAAIKSKLRPDYDVHVRKIFEAQTQSSNNAPRAGGFEYSWTRSGPVVGRVGTGFSQEEAKDMLRNPEKYVGRVAKVEAETKYPSGSLSKPAFKEWHLDKGDI